MAALFAFSLQFESVFAATEMKEIRGYGLAEGEPDFARTLTQLESLNMLASQIKPVPFIYYAENQKTLFSFSHKNIEVSGAVIEKREQAGDFYLEVRRMKTPVQIPEKNSETHGFRFEKETFSLNETLTEQCQQAVLNTIQKAGISDPEVRGIFYLSDLGLKVNDTRFVFSGKIQVMLFIKARKK